MFKLLRAKAKKKGGFPWKLYPRLKRFGNPNKPYFIGSTPDGIRYLGDYRDFPSVAHMAIPEVNQEVMAFLKAKVLARQGCFVDVGTNIGVLASFIAKALENRDEVFGFEPVPDTCKRAAAAFALNEIKNVKLFQAALGAEDGEITFFATPGNSAIASVFKHEFELFNTWSEIKVPVRTLDSLRGLGAIPKVAVIKMDVEGYEPQAVRGSLHTLNNDGCGLLFEYTPEASAKHGWTATDVAALVEGARPTRFETLHDDGSITAFPPPKESTEQVNIYCE